MTRSGSERGNEAGRADRTGAARAAASEERSGRRTIERLCPDEADAVLDFLTAAQQDPATRIASLGETRAGIRSELEDLGPSWTGTARVVHDPGGAIRAVGLVDWDEEIGRAWIHGPWASPEVWSAVARPLLDALRAQIPPSVSLLELCGPVENVRLAGLAAALGWTPTEVNHVLVLEGPALRALGARRSPESGDRVRVRRAVGSDLEAVRGLHEREFPAAYYSASQLLEQEAGGEAVLLVAGPVSPGEEGGSVGLPTAGTLPDGSVLGYVAGRVQPDGDGYVDFLAVAPEARGLGLGRALMRTLAAALLERAPVPRICLTVRDSLGPARALYGSLGFRVDASIVGYRSSGPGTPPTE